MHARYGFGNCSLVKELEENCQVKSLSGENRTAGSFGGMLMNFGGKFASFLRSLLKRCVLTAAFAETDCYLVIKQCYRDQCYSFRDLTNQ
jgi:hypothetical protein